MTYNFHPTSLREYDIRGIIGETLGPDDAYAIGRGFGTLVARAGKLYVITTTTNAATEQARAAELAALVQSVRLP